MTELHTGGIFGRVGDFALNAGGRQSWLHIVADWSGSKRYFRFLRPFEKKEEAECQAREKKEEAERQAREKKEEADQERKEEADRKERLELEKMNLDAEMRLLQAKIEAGIIKNELDHSGARSSDEEAKHPKLPNFQDGRVTSTFG
ncbi:hypothetical protein PoB_006895000 [Plakobranchus ocellatus]|uniref:Uncharacterized protein n=1 Tax=Plakobranchus ocellatus TaxID=259542 RepID=A0AAV4DEB1_9GAST|nr:hypothetical protein PoB_006895000 [Plakobranchus ocellatus]